MFRVHSLAGACLGIAAGIIPMRATGAQTANACYGAALAPQPTPWQDAVSLQQFDPALGELQSIEITLRAETFGIADIENLANAVSSIFVSFSADLALLRHDMTAFMHANPFENFTIDLPSFDGLPDFLGPSSHQFIVDGAVSVVSQVIPYTPFDWALFQGLGLVSLPLHAAITANASGTAGELIEQYNQLASARVEVCYTYLPNAAPAFTPSCPHTSMASVGMLSAWSIAASDPDAGDIVTLTSTALPNGAFHDDPLPVTGNPASTILGWTPTAADVGTHTVTYTATDAHGLTSTCTRTIVVSECYQLLGRGGGNASIEIGGHLFGSQLHSIRAYFPVAMGDHPSFPVPMLESGSLSFSVQTVMFAPDVFPANAEQWSNRMRVTVLPGGEVTSELFGTLNGVHQNLSTFTSSSGVLYMTFPFTIDGM